MDVCGIFDIQILPLHERGIFVECIAYSIFHSQRKNVLVILHEEEHVVESAENLRVITRRKECVQAFILASCCL